MFSKSIMIPKHQCYYVQATDSVQLALSILEDKGIDALPVLNGDLYEGIVTRYDIYKSYFNTSKDKESFLERTTAAEVATHQEQYFDGREVFEETLLNLKEFPLLAVVNANKNFLGVATRFDAMEQFQGTFGMKRSGVRITFQSVETEGRIARLGDIIQQYHQSVISLVTFDDTDKLVRRIVLKIEKKENLERFINKLEKSGFRVLHVHED
jgi:CBS domain-containing protein